jgi:hypothetical protein
MALSLWTVKLGVLAGLQNGQGGAAGLLTEYADIVQPGLPVEIPPIAKSRRVYVLVVPGYTPSPLYGPSAEIRNEVYTIPIAVEVETRQTAPTDTGYQTAMGAMAALVAQMETIQGADPSWGGTCNWSGFSVSAEATGPIADQDGGGGWLSKALLQLHIKTLGN